MISAKWITNRNFDLLWYAGAAVTSYFMIYLNVALGVSALLLWWFWIVSVDGPHVFATISRTYLDTEERHGRARLLLGSLLWFLAGPACIAIAILARVPVIFFTFLTFAQLWAYWHVVRQHYGFMVLYEKKNGEPAGKSNPIDYYTFYILMLVPFVSFLLRHPQARQEFGLNPLMSQPENYIVLFLHGVIILTILFYAYQQVVAKTINVPKNLFLLACIPLHLLIFLHPYISTHVDLRLFAVFVTFYHNIQYQGIVWFYNRNRYHKPDANIYGPAASVSRNFLTYYACGILFTIIYRYSNWFFIGLKVPFSGGPNAISNMSIGGLFTIADLAVGFWWGFAFNHYYLDQKIWKVSKDRRLSNDLQLAPVTS